MTDRHRLTELIGMQVELADGRAADQVIDVRLQPATKATGGLSELVVTGLVVGRRRPGTLFGYDRHPHQGPWLIRTLVRRWHRRTSYVTWPDVDRVSWDDGVVHLRTNQLEDVGEPQG